MVLRAGLVSQARLGFSLGLTLCGAILPLSQVPSYLPQLAAGAQSCTRFLVQQSKGNVNAALSRLALALKQKCHLVLQNLSACTLVCVHCTGCHCGPSTHLEVVSDYYVAFVFP
jgi:hypothetical protein